MYLAEFCQDISGCDDFQSEMSKVKFLSPLIQVLGRPFSLEAIFQRYPYFVDKYTRGALQAKTIEVTKGNATLQLRLTEDTVKQFGPYRNRCASLICQSGKTAVTMIPAQMGGTNPATVTETTCMGDGEECCEWEITWLPPSPAKILWPVACVLTWITLGVQVRLTFPNLALWQIAVVSLFPPLLLWSTHLWWDLKKELQHKDTVLEEELRFVESGHEELRDVHVGQAQGLAQHDMLKQLFSAHVSNEVAEAIWEQREQFFYGHQPRSQKLYATVMFTDLEGFSTIAETMEPHTLFQWINNYIEVLFQTVMSHKGVVDAYFGDGIKVDYGVSIPRTTEQEICEDANCAVQSALQIEQELRTLNDFFLNEGLPPMRVRIGIATGSVMAGIIGSAKRMKYSTLGDTVNTAARLESHGKEFGGKIPPTNTCNIIIADSTKRYLDDQIPTKQLGPILVKGKNEPVIAYQVLT